MAQNSYNVEVKGWMFAVGGVVAAGLAYLHVVSDNGAGARINTIDAPKVQNQNARCRFYRATLVTVRLVVVPLVSVLSERLRLARK
jgi:hypothetical protein